MTGSWQKKVLHSAGLLRRVNRVNGHRRRAAVELVPRRTNNLPPDSFSPHHHLSLHVFLNGSSLVGRWEEDLWESTSAVWFSVLNQGQLCVNVLPSAWGSLRAHLWCRHTDSVISCRSDKAQLSFESNKDKRSNRWEQQGEKRVAAQHWRRKVLQPGNQSQPSRMAVQSTSTSSLIIVPKGSN